MTATPPPEPADDLYGEDPFDDDDYEAQEAAFVQAMDDTAPCTYPVWNPNRFAAWPHMGPCGYPEPHTHD